MEQDLGDLLLEQDAELLKEFEVTGEKSTSVLQVDRRVFNVDKDLTTQGGSGVDVMKNIPGLSVDVDGNVQMRGSNPQLLIDGRPTSMTLDESCGRDRTRGTHHQSVRSVRREHYWRHPERGAEEEY